MIVTRSLLFLLAALICFVIALLISVGGFTSGNETAWAFGGAISFVLAHLP